MATWTIKLGVGELNALMTGPFPDSEAAPGPVKTAEPGQGLQ